VKVPPYGFISYAHDDFSVFEALRKQLIAIERRFRIKFHEDTDLTGGDTVDRARGEMQAYAREVSTDGPTDPA